MFVVRHGTKHLACTLVLSALGPLAQDKGNKDRAVKYRVECRFCTA